jgi:hypothetical protein
MYLRPEPAHSFSFYAGGTFNIVKNDAGMFNINIVDGFVAKGINWKTM